MSAILFETLLIRFNNLRSKLAGLGIKLFHSIETFQEYIDSDEFDRGPDGKIMRLTA